MSRIFTSADQLIGKTPLLELTNIEKEEKLEAKIYANGTLVSTQTVDRTQHAFAYRADDVGTLTLRITAGSASKTITTTVAETDIDAEAETNALVLYLSSVGRSNNEANPGTWRDTSNNVSATLTGFNFASDGWVLDQEGITTLRVAGDARVTIPYQPFATDFRTSGKTIELEFATRDVMNYDAVIMSCMSGGRGFSLTTQKATLKSEQSEVSTQYKEDEHVRISFVVEKRSETYPLFYIYINGIINIITISTWDIY